MLDHTNDSLEIFFNFIIDKNLPKHQPKEQDKKAKLIGGNVVGINFQDIDTGFDGNGNGGWPTPPIINGGNGLSTEINIQKDNMGNLMFYNNRGIWKHKKDNMWLRLKIMLQFIRNKKLTPQTPEPRLTIQEFFRSIKMSCEEITKVDDRLNGYLTAIKHAEEFGQKALSEDLKARIEIIRLETLMYSMGLTKVVTEEQIVTFYKESEKGIQLSWIKNFGRIIPASLLENKKRADELEIFDNYVIMYYDSNQKSFKLTQEEKEAARASENAKRKDPILFGVLKNSRKLYYIGCWEDEFCDLTLDKFIEKFGDEAITKNDINVNKY